MKEWKVWKVSLLLLHSHHYCRDPDPTSQALHSVRPERQLLVLMSTMMVPLLLARESALQTSPDFQTERVLQGGRDRYR